MSSLLLTSLDFEENRKELIDYWTSKEQFTDYNFDASSLSFIADTFAYSTNYLGYVANSQFNETNLLTIQQRKNAVIKSADLGYDINRANPSTSSVTLSIIDTQAILDKYPSFDFLLDSLVLPRFSIFVSSDGTRFVNTEDIILNPENNYISTFEIREGNVVTDFELAVSNGYKDQNIILEELNLADIVLELKVDNVIWEQVQNVTLYEPTSEYYRVIENYKQTYTFIFGDDELGKIPPVGSSITLTYMTTSGLDGNNKSGMVLLGSLYVNGLEQPSNEIDNVAFETLTNTSSFGGNNKETLDFIKKIAPYSSQSNDRAVVTSDYYEKLSKNPIVEYVNVYGGDQLNPPQNGFIYATIKPTGSDSLTTDQEASIVSYMNQFIMAGLRFRISSPVFIYVRLDVSISYDPKNYSQGYVIGTAINTTRAYFMTAVESGYYNSNLICSIDSSDGVLNNKTITTFYVIISPSNDGVYYINLGQSLTPGTLKLNFGDGQGWYDDSQGKIKDLSTDLDIGTVDYDNGIVNVVGYNDLESDQNLYFETVSGDVELYQNILIRYDETSSRFAANQR